MKPDSKPPQQPPLSEPQPSDPDSDMEELAHYDDAIIARAFRWSLVALIVIGLAAGGGVFYLSHKPAPPPPKVTQISAPVTRPVPAAEAPVAKFRDITAAAGIHFVHANGAYGDKLLPETMGGGVAFFDYDNDGYPDLLLVNSTYWPGHIPEVRKLPTMALYHNDGHGHFQDVTAGSGLDVSFYGMGIAVGDYDNDGKVDVFISGVGQSRLFHNEGNGKFTDVTAQAGVRGSPQDWSTSCAFIDYDNDGKLDLFVCNYVRWSKEIDFEVGYKLVGIGRAYGQPMNFSGSFPYLYHNDGNGHFTDVSAQSGVQVKNPVTGVPLAKSLGVAPIDIDHDGWIDFVVANDTVQNFLFHNERNGTFKEIGAASMIAFDSYGLTRGAMGIDAGYYRNDSSLGIIVGNFANEMSALYVSQNKPLLFADEAITEGIGPSSRLLLKFGVFFFDYDLDGRLDVLTANGHLEQEIHKVQQSQTYAQPAQLFWNAGPHSAAAFVPVPPEKCGRDLFQPIVGRGSAFADLDGDGDLDVILTQIAGPPLLLRNDQSLHHHWIRLKLVGKTCNRDAIGSWVNLKVAGETISRQVMPTRSYLSQSELPVTIGLGNASRIDQAEIVWANGTKQILSPADIKLDSLTVVEQTNSIALADDSADDNALVVKALSEGNALLAAGKTDAAIQMYQKGLKKAPEDEDLHFNLAIAYAKAGQINQAIKEDETALNLVPDYAEVHNNLGNLLVKKGQYGDAIRHFEQALKTRPDYALAHNNLGTALGYQGNVTEAIPHFAEAARLKPDYLEAHFNLARSYAIVGRNADALAEYHEVLQLNPRFGPALAAIAKLQAEK